MSLNMHCNADAINNPTITYCETDEKDVLLSIKKNALQCSCSTRKSDNKIRFSYIMVDDHVGLVRYFRKKNNVGLSRC